MLLPGKRNCSDRLATILNEGALYNNGKNNDEKEEQVVEETLENIVDLAQLTGVDLVEHLHEHEGMENEGIVLNLLIVHHLNCLTINCYSVVEINTLIILKSEDLFATKEKGHKYDDLEESLTNDISPHVICNDLVVSGVGLSLKKV